MLLYFKTSNQLSFDEEVCFSTVAGSYKVKNEGTQEREEKLKQNLIPVPKYKVNLLRTSVIYGANASGKSNLLSAIAQSQNIISESFPESSNGQFLKDTHTTLYNRNKEANQTRPIIVSFAILIDEIEFVYSFAYTKERIVEESLLEYRTQKPIEHFHRLYDLAKGNYDWRFSNLFKGEKDTVKNITNQYALYLSVGAVSKLPICEKVFDWFKSTLMVIDSIDTEFSEQAEDVTLEQMRANDSMKKYILQQLQIADFTIVDFIFKEENNGSISVYTIHKIANAEGQEAEGVFDYVQESVGTRKFIAWLGLFANIFVSNAVLLVDEFGLSMHPLLSKHLLQFTEVQAEINHSSTAQFIFTTHDMELMTEELFRPDQIWVAEKDNIGNSKLYPLSKFKLLKGKNLKTTYLQGLYGGIPHFKTENE